jgi:hypothetical protein
MADKKDKKEVTVVAELLVNSAGQTERIKTFDRAWHRALELAVPVSISFDGWVRKD